jgi:hypothetical protein
MTPASNGAETGLLPTVMNDSAPPTQAIQPRFQESMPESPNSVTVVNRLSTWVGVGIFSGKAGPAYRYGVVQGVPAGGQITVGIPNGEFDVYWIRQDKPYSRFHNPTTFRVTDGNSNIRKLFTVTIGADGGETPVEETF